MERKTLAGLAILIAAATILLNGCSIIGLGIGAAIDASNPDQVNMPVGNVKTVKPGTKIIIVLKDSTQISGKYIGIEHVTEEVYAERYSKSRYQLLEKVTLPALGDSLKITFVTSVNPFECEFLGFDYDVIWLRFAAATNPNAMHISKLISVTDSRGNALDLEATGELISESKIPLLSSIGVQGEAGRKNIAMENVHQIQAQVGGKNGALICCLIGIAIDAYVLYKASSPDFLSFGFGY